MADHPESDVVDDETIADDAELWRRIPPWHVVADANLGDMRPSSNAFQDNPDGTSMSVYVAAECKDHTLVMQGHEGFTLAAIGAGVFRARGQKIRRVWIEGDPPGHVEVVGKKNHGARSYWARQSRWVVRPQSMQH